MSRCYAISLRRAAADGRRPHHPERLGEHRRVCRARRRFHEDLARLGLRKRRVHDLRRTFISLALADGARNDVLRWVTHGPDGDIVDLYTTLPWRRCARRSVSSGSSSARAR
jgi:integrase